MATTYTSYDQLPLALNADDVAAVLGISRANAYTLMHSKDFPTITIVTIPRPPVPIPSLPSRSKKQSRCHIGIGSAK